MDTKLKKMTETEKRILLWMLTDLSMVLILCGKLLRKWASEFEWGMWRMTDAVSTVNPQDNDLW